MKFEVLATDGAARAGRLTTSHGVVETPIFMPVGTRAAVKALAPDDLHAAGAQIVLANTYHLFLRPGHDVVRELGGLHRFMGWDGTILTDSGGFQVFSLSKLRKITEAGVEFRSPVDGSTHFLSPEIGVEVQQALGADIIHPLDECLAYPVTRLDTERSLELTLRWAARSKAAHAGPGATNLITGIAAACVAHSPVIAIAGGPPSGHYHKDAFQEFDLVGMFAPVTKLSIRIDSPTRIPELFRLALRTAMSGRKGPVFIDIPRDVLNDQTVTAEILEPASYRPLQAAAAEPGGHRPGDERAARGAPAADAGRWRRDVGRGKRSGAAAQRRVRTADDHGVRAQRRRAQR